MRSFSIDDKEYKFDFEDLKKVSVSGVGRVYKLKTQDGDYFIKLEEENKLSISTNKMEIFASFLLRNIMPKELTENVLEYKNAQICTIPACASKSFLKEGEKEISLEPIMLVDFYNKCNKEDKRSFADFEENASIFVNFYLSVMTDKREYEMRINGVFTKSVEHIVFAVRDYCEEMGYSCDYDALKKDLQIMAVCDYFLSNYDRNNSNVVFILDENQTLRLAPIFDNSLCLGNLWSRSEANFEEFKEKGLYLFSDSRIALTLESERMPKGKKANLNIKQILASEIQDLSKKSVQIHQIVQNFNRLNLDRAFNIFAYEKGIKFSKEEKERINLYFNLKKQAYAKVHNKQKHKINALEKEMSM